MARRSHSREIDEITCRKCDTTFNLAAQYYYDNLCPSCKREDESEEEMEARMAAEAERGL